MNYLDLAVRTALECGVKGAVPQTVVGQTGNLGRIVAWVNSAWIDIQSAHQDWQWLRTSTSWLTVAGQPSYTTTECNCADFGMWANDTFRNYVTATGLTSEIQMTNTDYDLWRNTYLFGANRNTKSRPIEVAICPDKSIAVGPIADVGYTMTGDYYKAPTSLSVDTDTPVMPSQFHMAIVYRAMMSYGAFEAAPEVYQRGELEFKKLMNRIELDRLPTISFSGSLC